jgi:hypothetical protein
MAAAWRAVIAACVIELLAAANALACSCAPPTAEGLMQSAPAIFTGAVTESVRATQGESITTFTVSEGFKGVRAGQSVRIRHRSGSSASCGVTFAVGRTYTLSTYREEVGTTLFANLCSTAFFITRDGEQIIRRLRQVK